MRVCVFCGASPSASPLHIQLAERTGRLLAEAGHSVVFGGGANGMMGAMATGAVAAGGKVVGILPTFLFEREPPHPGVEEIHVVESMHERKAMMYEMSDAFITLPGGFGTLDETLEIMTWSQLSLHSKPIVFVGDGAFWSGLQATFDVMRSEGFLSDADRSIPSFVEQPEDALEALAQGR